MVLTTLDKLVLKTSNFNLDLSKCDWKYNANGYIDEGELIQHEPNYFFNSKLASFDIKKDKKGFPAAFITFNPNRIPLSNIEQYCKEMGISTNISDCSIIRCDVERTIQLNYNPIAYHPILKHSKVSEHMKERTSGKAINETLNIGTKYKEIQCYNKTLEQLSKGVVLDDRMCRIEARLLNRKHNLQYGINSVRDFTKINLNELYCNVLKSIINPDKFDSLNVVALDERYSLLHKMVNQYGASAIKLFIQVEGLKHIGIDVLINYINGLELSKQQRYYYRNVIKKMDKDTKTTSKPMIDELRQYFKIA